MRYKYSSELLQTPEKSKITNLGFVWQLPVHDFGLVYSALETFKSLNTHLLVPFRFIVPHDDINYPENTWGIPLGKVVSNIRNKGIFAEHKEQLTALGFDYRKRADQANFDVVYAALQAYQKASDNKSCLLIPSSFIVPHNDANYSEDAWGIQLGAWVYMSSF